MSATSSSPDVVEVRVKPKPGFCVKTVATDDNGSYVAAASSSASQAQAKKATHELLEPSPSALGSILTSVASSSASSRPMLEVGKEPATNGSRIRIPKGAKLFLNMAWDASVPGPPPSSETTIRRAMAGEDLDLDLGLGPEREGAYYVPIVVSDPREAVDKKGAPSLVVDCVLSEKVKERSKKDREFRLYLIGASNPVLDYLPESMLTDSCGWWAATELALEHVEGKLGCALSREVGTPNIAAKGTLEERTVLMPRSLVEPSSSSSKSKAIVQEVDASPRSRPAAASTHSKPKPILKNSPGNTTTLSSNLTPAGIAADGGPRRPLIEELPSDDNIDAGRQSGATSRAAAGPAKTDAEAPSATSALESRSLTRELEAEDVGVEEMQRRMRLPPLRWTWVEEGSKIKVEVDAASLVRHYFHHPSLSLLC